MNEEWASDYVMGLIKIISLGFMGYFPTYLLFLWVKAQGLRRFIVLHSTVAWLMTLDSNCFSCKFAPVRVLCPFHATDSDKPLLWSWCLGLINNEFNLFNWNISGRGNHGSCQYIWQLTSYELSKRTQDRLTGYKFNSLHVRKAWFCWNNEVTHEIIYSILFYYILFYIGFEQKKKGRCELQRGKT